jgi:hypothetical protein
MPAATWSIDIVAGANPGDPASFKPSNLLARVNDVVSWNNLTHEPHLIWQLDGSGNPIALPVGGSRWAAIPPQQQSPAWSVAGTTGQTIQYGCLLHPNQSGGVAEIGTITITT